MKRPTNLRVGDQFRVIVGNSRFNEGEIVTLKEDDDTESPLFWNADKSDYHSIYFSNLEPYIKTIRDAQIGDVVVNKLVRDEHLVLERGQSTVLLSYGNRFKKVGNTMVFDELEKFFTLKADPEVVDDRIAEAIKLLEKAGYNIEKKNAQPSISQAGSGGAADHGAGGSGLC